MAFFPLNHILTERANTFAFLFHLSRYCIGAGSPRGNYRNHKVAVSHANHNVPSEGDSGLNFSEGICALRTQNIFLSVHSL